MSSRATAGVSRSILVALVVAALLVTGCRPGAGSGSSAVPTTSVDLPPSYRFVPAAIVVPVGSTVTWINHDNFTHNVALDGAEPLQMAPGESVSHPFEALGTFAYVCSLHPKDMKGTVLVTGS